MSIVDEIEAELKQISPWPWKRTGLGVDTPEQTLWFNKKPDATFFAKSPERLAALCRYVRAEEALLVAWTNYLTAKNFGEIRGEFRSKRKVLQAELQAARRELGIKE